MDFRSDHGIERPIRADSPLSSIVCLGSDRITREIIRGFRNDPTGEPSIPRRSTKLSEHASWFRVEGAPLIRQVGMRRFWRDFRQASDSGVEIRRERLERTIGDRVESANPVWH
jgi:hypothetical protein